MNIILDLAVVAILALTIVIGYKKGFIKSLMGLASGILALVIAFVFTPALAGIIDTGLVRPTLVSVVEEQIASNLPDDLAGEDLVDFIRNAPAELAEFLDSLGIDHSALDSYLLPGEGSDADAPDTLEEISQTLAAPLSRVISSVLAFIVIYVAALVILRIVTAMLDGVFRLPLLKLPNKILGGVIGAVTGLITCFVLCSVVGLLLPYLAGSDNPLFADVTADKTLIFRFFCGFEAVGNLLGTVLK